MKKSLQNHDKQIELISIYDITEGFFSPDEKITVLQSFIKTEADNTGILHIYSFRILEGRDIYLQGIHFVL